jgi:hypothetical protein
VKKSTVARRGDETRREDRRRKERKKGLLLKRRSRAAPARVSATNLFHGNLHVSAVIAGGFGFFGRALGVKLATRKKMKGRREVVQGGTHDFSNDYILLASPQNIDS